MPESFFDGRVTLLRPQMHLKVLRNSYAVVLAVDDSKSKVIGFVNAISDGIFGAHIEMFEVLQEYRRRSYGTGLFKRILSKLEYFFGVNLMCDENLLPFYERFAMTAGKGMNIRNFNWLSEMNADT